MNDLIFFGTEAPTSGKDTYVASRYRLLTPHGRERSNRRLANHDGGSERRPPVPHVLLVRPMVP
jgi:hypothetical protein